MEESLQATVPEALEGRASFRRGSTQKNSAFGRPGIEPRWTHGDKDGVGTAYAVASRIWFTLWNGIVTEVYYPTVDHPQIRDLQCLITDGKTFFHEEKRDLKSVCERLSGNSLGYRYTNSDSENRYSIVKEIITNPHLACILQHVQLIGDEAFISKLHLYMLCAPHLQVGGWSNNGYVIQVAGRKILMARRSQEYGWHSGAHCNFLELPVATLAKVTAGPISPITFKWTGSSIRPLTETSH